MNQITAIPLSLPEGHAIKFVNHRSYDKLLCNHVYQQFCPDCPQYECTERRT